MAKTEIQEIQILKYFETQSIKKASLLFSIVQNRMQMRRLEGSDSASSSTSPKKRRSKNSEVRGEERSDDNAATV
jgi:hypothetical protein